MGWIAACVLVALLLPLMAMLYLDNLTVNKRAEKNLEKTEKLERQMQELKREIERERREKKPSDNISDNSVFDRVRRPLSISLPKPDKLE